VGVGEMRFEVVWRDGLAGWSARTDWRLRLDTLRWGAFYYLSCLRDVIEVREPGGNCVRVE
jgi:hypothetical protein